MTKYVGESNLTYIVSKIKAALATKVDAVEGMGLSANSYTDEAKAAVEGMDAAIAAVVEEKVDEVNVLLDAKIEQANASIEATMATLITQAVNDAIQDVEGSTEVAVVADLPDEGALGTIYLMPSGSGNETNKYDEYVWTGEGYEKLGGEEPEVFTSEEIDSLWES